MDDILDINSTSHQYSQEELQELLSPEQLLFLENLKPLAEERTETEIEPASFVFNDITYTHIENETKFSTDRSETGITLIGLMKEALPKLSYSLRKTITPPDSLYMFSHSVRMKVTRAAQLCYFEPPITPETSSFTPVFNYLRETRFMENAYGFSRQYNAGLWASSYDDELASSLYLHYGPPQGFDRISMQSPAIVKLQREEDEFVIEITYTHTIQDRIDSACHHMWSELQKSKMRAKMATRKELQLLGFKEVYWYAGTYLSIGKLLHEQIQSAINTYLDKMMEFETGDYPPPAPEILDPEDFLPAQIVRLPYADFLFNEEATIAQLKQRTANGVALLERTLITKLADINFSTIITRKTHPQLTSDNLTCSVKHGYLERVKQGQYQPTKKLITALAVEGGTQ